MPALRELQQSFLEGVLAPGEHPVAAAIRDEGLTSQRRLAIYRNNVFWNYRNALQAVYPVVLKLVGEPFFNHAADPYIRSHPSRCGDLNEFGEGFAEFLADYPPARDLPYLPDVARLEWLWHRVFHSPDHPPLDVARLAGVPQERWGELRFRLHPASALMASDYPVLHIWQVNQDGFEGDQSVDLSEGGVRVLLYRRADYVIDLTPVGAGEFEFLRALQAGDWLAGALEAAQRVEEGFDLQACLARHVRQGTLVDFELG